MDKILKKLGYLQAIESTKYPFFIVYHSLFGFPQILNKDGLDLLNIFSCSTSVRDVLSKNIFDDAQAQIDELEKNFFIVPADFDERVFMCERIIKNYLPALKNWNRIEYLSLILSEQCNFACSYCISNSMISASERRHNVKKIMDIETAKKAVDLFFSILRENNKKIAYINFGGGEPLINWKVMKEVLQYCKQNYAGNFEIIFSINTNGSLVDLDIARQLKNFDVKIALSLDGLEIANNKVRVLKSGAGTFDLILRAMDILCRIDYDLVGFSTTVNESNFDYIDESIVEFALKRKLREIRIDLDVIHLLNIPVQNVVEKLILIKRAGAQNGINVTGFWERPAENLNFSILEKHVGFCGGIVGKSMCVNPLGDVYICGYSTRSYANIYNFNKADIQSYLDIILGRLAVRKERCKNCPIEWQCAGGCHITEEFNELDSNAALEYNCELFKLMTVELLRDSLEEAVAS